MTVIVAALTKTQGVVIAADSQITYGGQKQFDKSSKLWVIDKWVMGAAGSLRKSQVLKHNVTWPKYRPDEDTDWEVFLIKTVVPAIRAGVKDQGIVRNDNGVEYFLDQLIVANGNHLAEFATDGSLLTPSADRVAIGSGYAEALGSLGNKGPWTQADVIQAAHRATQTANGVHGPIAVADTKTLTVRTLEAP